MKFVFRNLSLYGLSLFVLQLVFSGVMVKGGFLTYILGALTLTILFNTIKPLLHLIALPINFLTMGLFTFVINAFMLYLLTVFISNITITGFMFQGASFLGFIIPKIQFNAFFAYIICAIVISCLTTFILWIFD